MKRAKLIKHLESNGCEFDREGKKHTLYRNVPSKKMAAVPRHSDINENLVLRICKDLGITKP